LATVALMAGPVASRARAGTVFSDVFSAPNSANYGNPAYPKAEPNLFYDGQTYTYSSHTYTTPNDLTNGAAVVASGAQAPVGGFYDNNAVPSTTQSILEHLSSGVLAGDTFTRVADFGPGNDQLWNLLNGKSGTVTITARWAGDVSQFGTYSKPYTPLATSFTPATDGSSNPLFITGTGYGAVFNTKADGTGTSSSTATYTGTNPIAFGLHNTTTKTYLSSIDALNADGLDHMVTFAINGGKGGYLLAFEDRLKSQNGDFDHNDAVVQIQGASPTPEPATMIMALTALPALGLARKLRKREATA
jgi:hypothetical protein